MRRSCNWCGWIRSFSYFQPRMRLCAPSRAKRGPTTETQMFERTQALRDASVYRLHVQSLDSEEAARFAEQSHMLDLTLPVVLDLAEVGFADSSGIGCILSLQRMISAAEGKLFVAGLQPRVRGLFELVQLHRVVDLFNDVDEALRTLRHDSGAAAGAGPT